MKLFVPYSGSNPASISVNGHKVLIVFQNADKEELESEIALLGADRVRKLKAAHSEEELQDTFVRLARKIDGGVVIAPEDSRLQDVLHNLENSLPWIH